MPPKVGATPTPPVHTTGPAASPQQTGEAGNFEGQSVQSGGASTERTAPDPRQLVGSARSTLGAAESGASGFINQPSATPHQPSARQAHRLSRFRGSMARTGAWLAKKFSRRPGGTTGRPGSTTTPLAAGGIDMTRGLAEAARSGIDAAKDNLLNNILKKEYDSEHVQHVLTSGDSGIRRATTALNNLRNMLKPETQPAESLQGTPAQWAAQTRTISNMAQQVENAEFSQKVPGRFLDYGTSNNNPYTAVQEHPEVDHDVRAWLLDGVDLLDQMLSAQERAFQGKPPLGNDETASLQASISRFTDADTRLDLTA